MAVLRWSHLSGYFRFYVKREEKKREDEREDEERYR